MSLANWQMLVCEGAFLYKETKEPVISGSSNLAAELVCPIEALFAFTVCHKTLVGELSDTLLCIETTGKR